MRVWNIYPQWRIPPVDTNVLKFPFQWKEVKVKGNIKFLWDYGPKLISQGSLPRKTTVITNGEIEEPEETTVICKTKSKIISWKSYIK